mmetsp:Transcript_6630/g.8270  ORF Transcript_6630/g.8270 Transcript_6630/m.8270 type:complete len:82 (+) Transcript_6630:52-297(+)|eukprot:CAMPEP_0172506250 /NCGR_PEP_ID=MMETSP1066-20121228/193186_1 /TAXON_ID=671091 /ORGANISM="Coscinodiscus wailesii, Strain CCMP2513" /LENGTH=81 /DNA_ID=CAMNT_0013283189 /DNA_START=51 /DNA_END=296 /DNA_ORIENTATION=+
MSRIGDLPPLPAPTASSEGSARLEQLLDEEDHKRCTDGNKAALLAESLDRLRALTKEIEEDDWKYSTNFGETGYSRRSTRT